VEKESTEYEYHENKGKAVKWSPERLIQENSRHKRKMVKKWRKE
jgi:hypothetical protein